MFSELALCVLGVGKNVITNLTKLFFFSIRYINAVIIPELVFAKCTFSRMNSAFSSVPFSFTLCQKREFNTVG